MYIYLKALCDCIRESVYSLLVIADVGIWEMNRLGLKGEPTPQLQHIYSVFIAEQMAPTVRLEPTFNR